MLEAWLLGFYMYGLCTILLIAMTFICVHVSSYFDCESSEDEEMEISDLESVLVDDEQRN